MSTRTGLAKRVSNYELFFDLAFLLALRELNGSLHMEHISLQNVLVFAMANIVLMNIWFNEVLYYQKYGDSRRIDIYTVIGLMFVVGHLGMSLNFDTASLLPGSSVVIQFNGLLFVAYGIILLQYWLKGRQLGFNRDMKLSMLSLGLYMVVLLPFITGLLGWGPWMMFVFVFPVFLPMILSFFYKEQEELPTNFPHAVERWQLITILSFGESVIAIIGTYSLGEHLLWSALLFFGMACMFINYMSQTFLGVDHHSKRPVGFLFYLHLMIVMGINMFTVSTELLADSHHAVLGHWMLVAGVTLFYLGTYGTTVFNQAMYRLRKEDQLILWGLILATVLALVFVGTNVLGIGLALIIGSYALGFYFYIFRIKVRRLHQVPQPDPRSNPRDFSK